MGLRDFQSDETLDALLDLIGAVQEFENLHPSVPASEAKQFPCLWGPLQRVPEELREEAQARRQALDSVRGHLRQHEGAETLERFSAAFPPLIPEDFGHVVPEAVETAPRSFQVGDRVRVGQNPRYSTTYGTSPSSLKPGSICQINSVWDDGDLSMVGGGIIRPEDATLIESSEGDQP